MEEMSRRNFLGWTAVGAAGLLVPELIRPRVTTVVFGSGQRLGFIPVGYMVLDDGTRIPVREIRARQRFEQFGSAFEQGGLYPVVIGFPFAETEPKRFPGSRLVVCGADGREYPLIEGPTHGSLFDPAYALWDGE
jgi:hypothetical protein